MGLRSNEATIQWGIEISRASVTLVTWNQVEEGLVNTCVVGEFGMEGRCHDLSLPHGHGIAALGCHHFHSGPHALDPGCADEHHLNRSRTQLVLDKPAFAEAGYPAAAIGRAEPGSGVDDGTDAIPWPERDEVDRVLLAPAG